MTALSGSYNGLNFGTGTQLPIITREGWKDEPSIRARDSARTVDHGDNSAADLTAGRTVRLTLGLQGASSSDLEVLRNLVWSKFQVGSTPIALTINDQQVFAKVRRRDIEEDQSAPWRLGACRLEFYCPDPHIYSAGENVQTTGLATSSSGLVIPWVLPISLGAGATGGSLMVTNSGNAPTPLSIKYSGGQLTNPGSTQTETGRRLKMNLVVGSAENLVIDTGAHTVLLNGVTSRRTFLTVDQWFTLPPGTSTITFEADASTGVPQMELRWRSAWL